MTQFIVQLDQFDGPLDLMLHLIRDKKLNLHDLNVDVLTEQYILFINSVENKLDLAAEYIHELANLIEIKSARALPIEPKVLDSEDYQEDPQAALVRRLLEYQQFKDISSVLHQRYQERQMQFDKPMASTLLDLADREEVHLYQADQRDLVRAMERCIVRFQTTHPREVKLTKIEMSIEDRMDYLISRIYTLKEPFYFDDFVQDAHHINVFIITFLAILELIRVDFLQFERSHDDVQFRKGTAYEFIA